MREIKFRAWDKQTKSFDYWGFIDESFAGLTQNSNNPRSLRELKELSQQFTGLKDKNGKEIYEGDLLKWTHPDGEVDLDGEVVTESYQVLWKTPKFIMKTTDKHGYIDDLDGDVVEVIGDVHSTPELLTNTE